MLSYLASAISMDGMIFDGTVWVLTVCKYSHLRWEKLNTNTNEKFRHGDWNAQ